jgi:predicted Rossmann fold flavoprotein
MAALMEQVDVIILGAGAAGMACAVEAGRRGRRVVLIDHARAPGEKIRISGGGRCNFTNRHIAPDTVPERFLSQNPRFALSALARYTADDFIARVTAAGIAWHEKTLGQLFCDGSAVQIIDMLRAEMAGAGVELRLSTEVRDVRHDGGFCVETGNGAIRATALVVATGGKSIPKMGATGLGYRIAEQFGLRLTEVRPGLVPLTFAADALDLMQPLSGVSVAARVGCGAATFDEGLLFTHRGLSGPSILQISNYWREGGQIMVDLARGQDIARALGARRQQAGRVSVKNALAALLPEKLARQVVARAGVAGNLADQSNADLDRIADAVHRWQVTPAGSEGYRTAEVTLGGVDTRDLDARTLAARKVPGLHFIGEVVDVTGWLGGYNFQWAWSSGWAAGQAV